MRKIKRFKVLPMLDTTIAPVQQSDLRLADITVKKQMGELEPLLGFSANFFMMFGLPTKKYNQQTWVKENPRYTFNLTQTNPRFDVPYGCYARLNQIFIDTQITTTRSNVVNLGNSFNAYVKKLGYTEGGAYRGLKKQLLNLIRCSISVEAKIPNMDIGIQTLVGRKWYIDLDEKSPDQPELFKSKVLIDSEYAKFVIQHAVPLDLHVVKIFKRNPLALDFYRFIAYRNNGLSKPLVLKDENFFDQLGSSIAEAKVTKFRLDAILKKIQTYWHVKAKFEKGCFHLFPSPPAVGNKLSSNSPLKIVHNLEDI